MEPTANRDFQARLVDLLGEDLAAHEWPLELPLTGKASALLDPRNALIRLVGVGPELFAAEGRLGRPPVGPAAGDGCSRLVVLARTGQSAAWRARGFVGEATLAGFWRDGQDAEVWTAMWGARAQTQPERQAARASSVTKASPIWTCRTADASDAGDIHTLLGRVFSDYQVPGDPGVVRYALATGDVHGRVVRSAHGRLLAYASVEFQAGVAAVEITDCATDPTVRGQGLMTHVIGRLQEDLVDVFAGRRAYAFARADQPGMARVFQRLGWRQTGQLVNHYAVGRRWLAAGVWCAPRSV